MVTDIFRINGAVPSAAQDTAENFDDAGQSVTLMASPISLMLPRGRMRSTPGGGAGVSSMIGVPLASAIQPG